MKPLASLRRNGRLFVALALVVALAWLVREKFILEAQVASLRAQLIARDAHVARPASPIVARKSTDRLPPATVEPPPVRENEATGVRPDEVVVSLGTVEQIGSAFAEFYTSELARKLRQRAALVGGGDPVTPEEELAAQRQFSEVLGALPEIASFQDSPEEYGMFFKSLLQAGAGLSDAEAQQVEVLMRARAQEAIALGLNNGNKPTDGALAWEWKRDSFIGQSADLLNNLLPPQARERFPVNSALMEFLEMDFDKSADLAPTIGPSAAR